MHIGHIEGTTRTLGAPTGWDRAEYGACLGLPIRDEVLNGRPINQMTSAWLPTPEEIARIVEGQPVYLTVVGTNHPPVIVWA